MSKFSSAQLKTSDFQRKMPLVFEQYVFKRILHFQNLSTLQTPVRNTIPSGKETIFPYQSTLQFKHSGAESVAEGATTHSPVILHEETIELRRSDDC